MIKYRISHRVKLDGVRHSFGGRIISSFQKRLLQLRQNTDVILRHKRLMLASSQEML